LLAAIGAGQDTAGSLHGKTQALQQLAHVSGMVSDTELLFDHPGYHRRGPYSAVQSIGHGTAVEEVAEPPMLRFAQPWRPPGAIAFQQGSDSVSLIPRQPLGHLGARRLENPCQIAAGSAFGIQDDGLQAFRHAVSAIALSLLPQLD
jgi:hypothetical protein